MRYRGSGQDDHLTMEEETPVNTNTTPNGENLKTSNHQGQNGKQGHNDGSGLPNQHGTMWYRKTKTTTRTTRHPGNNRKRNNILHDNGCEREMGNSRRQRKNQQYHQTHGKLDIGYDEKNEPPMKFKTSKKTEGTKT
jgi:hypothetical protein